MDLVFLTRTNRPVAVKVLSEILKEQKLHVKGVVAEETLRGKSISFLKRRFLRQVKSYGVWGVTQQVILLVWNKVLHSLGIGCSDMYVTLEDLQKIHDFDLHVVQNMHDQDTIDLIREMKPDIGVVVGTGILKPKVFKIPKLGTINLHQGKVPEYRGGPPAFWELFNDEKRIEVTVHFIDASLDTGDIVLQKDAEITVGDSLSTLENKVNELGKHAMVEALVRIKEGTVKPIPQSRRELQINRLPTKEQRKMLEKKLRERKRLREIYTAPVDREIS